MAVVREKIKANLDAVLSRIADAARRVDRAPSEVRLVAVTKSVGVEKAQVLLDLGVEHLGENRVDVAAPKIEALGNGTPVCWHMIGNVQRRRVPKVVRLFNRVDAVDRLSLAEALEGRCEAAEIDLNILLEINVSGETSKHGFVSADLAEVLDKISSYKHLTVDGLMTMAPVVANVEETRPVFAGLRELARTHGLKRVSMGMSNDFEVAIEEGATEVRIGSALFQ